MRGSARGYFDCQLGLHPRHGPWNKETASLAWALEQGDCFSCIVPGTTRLLLLHGLWNKETTSPAWVLEQEDCFSCMVPGTRRLLLLHGPWNKETASPAWSLEKGDCYMDRQARSKNIEPVFVNLIKRSAWQSNTITLFDVRARQAP